MISVILPACNERFLPETVKDLVEKSTGEVEIIAVLDGYWPAPALPEYPQVKTVHLTQRRGMRGAINAGATIARGEWLCKMDAHCMVSPGWDEVMARNCDKDWLLIPRRYSLDPEAWTLRDKKPVGHHYLDCPMTNPEYFQFHGVIWPEHDRERASVPIDDLMSWQGSMWFMHRDHWNRIGPMREDGYGTFSQEPQELGLKTWLGGGAIKLINLPEVWYAHLHKGKQFGRMYKADMGEIKRGHMYSAWYWCTNQWSGRIRNIEWLFEKFMPLPKWPNNWMELLWDYQRTHKDGPG